jgi:hypothetical protein
LIGDDNTFPRHDDLGDACESADVNFIWPQGKIAVVGAEPAVNILYRQELRDAKDPDTERKRLVDEYSERFANPYIAASRGYVDDVIDPRDTRWKIIRAFEMLRSKTDTMPSKSTATCRSRSWARVRLLLGSQGNDAKVSQPSRRATVRSDRSRRGHGACAYVASSRHRPRADTYGRKTFDAARSE